MYLTLHSKNSFVRIKQEVKHKLRHRLARCQSKSQTCDSAVATFSTVFQADIAPYRLTFQTDAKFTAGTSRAGFLISVLAVETATLQATKIKSSERHFGDKK